MTITFDITNKGNSITFNNNNLTATATQSQFARASTPIVSDHTYFEVKYDSFVGTNSLLIGVVSGSANLVTDSIAGLNIISKSRLYAGLTGFKYDGKGASFGGSTYGSIFTTGDYIGVYVNIRKNSIAFYKNGVYQGVAFSDINTLDGDKIYAGIGSGTSTVGNSVTATINFGDNPFKYIPDNLPREARAYNQKLIKSFIALNTVNKYYSLSNNTLIHLPNNSPKNMILHGIEQGKEIQLDVPFTKHNYVCESPTTISSGKVFTQDFGRINNLNIREVK